MNNLSDDLMTLLATIYNIQCDLESAVDSCEMAIQEGDKTRATREKYTLAVKLADTFSTIEEQLKDFHAEIDYLEGE